MLKRGFDVFASVLGLVFFSPLLLAIAAWIKFDSSGPVFYRGRRGGRHGKPFGIFKFRSMMVNADKIGGPSTSGSDPRVTRSGRFIRKFKLDELSQLINVVLGDMSLVGPRPEVLDKLDAYTGDLAAVLEVRPGITDWASIWNSDEGGVLEGTPDADVAYEKILRPTKLKMQLEYVKTRTFLGDIKIILCTLLRIVNKKSMPREITGYPTFAELRAEAEKLIEEHRSSSERTGMAA